MVAVGTFREDLYYRLTSCRRVAAGAHEAKGCAPSTPAHETAPISLDKRVRALEVESITGALSATHGNKARATEFLQMNRSTLVDRMNRCGIGRASADEASEFVSVPA